MNLEIEQVIDGKRYSTKTATKLGEVSHGYASDFEEYEEALFRTPRGNYFVAGRGGAMSHYSSPLPGNSRGGGSGARALSAAEALAWAEQNDQTACGHFEIEDA